ncbi:hypothetical protein IMZ48_42630, partial [Candidatus Bathyarchaeota archaeon]|nr:hypothetical protein [Candidatus Bathyarchaeota archaeon]
MKRLNQFYELMRATKKPDEDKSDAKKDTRHFYTLNESESAKQISTQAFLTGEPAKINCREWDTFFMVKGELEESTLHPIDIVQSDPDATELLALTLKSTNTQGSKSFVSVDSWNGREMPLPEEREPVERIRIHSGQLFDIFKAKISDDHRWTMAEDHTMVIRRPFRELHHNREELSKHLAKLEAHFKTYDATGHTSSSPREEDHPESALETPDPTAANGSNPTPDNHKHEDNDDVDDMPNTITSLLHLRSLMYFIDTEVTPRAEFIRSIDYKEVRFNDLWHLYKPGDEVIDASEKQAYRVVEVLLPHHDADNRVIVGSPRDENRRAHFTLYCVYIDFDGKRFGPVSHKVII